MSEQRGWSLRRLVPFELMAAAAMVSSALAFTREVGRQTDAVADRLGHARCQLDALIAAMGRVPTLPVSGEADPLPAETELRARLGVHDWAALFGDRCVMLEHSRNAAGWVLVLQPNRASSCGTH
jgi:hypothetical protein